MIEKITGTTRLCGVIGNPIAHTFSPLIHNTLAGKCGQNLVYVPFHVRENLDCAVKGSYSLNVLGMNVTVPYKSEVIKSLVDIDDAAQIIGAVNTLVRIEGGYKGYNTDYLGLKRAANEDGIVIKNKPVILFGAGGAARAAAYLAGSMEAKELYIVNRTKDKAQCLADEISGLFSSLCINVLGSDEVYKLPDQKYTAIQTTNVGMWPNVGESVINDDKVFKMIDQAVDIIFNPEETKFMSKVRENGGFAVNGLKMLLYQAIIAYELWNDISVPDEYSGEIYELLKKEFEH